MANIKISELNEMYEQQKDYNDYVPVVDTSADETKKISVKNLIRSNVQLIAVTDTEPAEYETGDKYYNTTDNRIYTATSSGWANAETPIRNIFYVVISDKTTYTYDDDNETLISVGGGGGSSVVVEPDEPTEDTKLIIEESDLDFQGLEISDEYTTGDNVAYSCNYVNGIIERGSNSNGNYIKYADGTLINTKTISGAGSASVWENNIYYKDVTNGDWALSFTNLWNVQVSNATSQFWTTIYQTSTTSAGKTRLIRASAGSSTTDYDIQIFAIGSWK